MVRHHSRSHRVCRSNTPIGGHRTADRFGKGARASLLPKRTIAVSRVWPPRRRGGHTPTRPSFSLAADSSHRRQGVSPHAEVLQIEGADEGGEIERIKRRQVDVYRIVQQVLPEIVAEEVTPFANDVVE